MTVHELFNLFWWVVFILCAIDAMDKTTFLFKLLLVISFADIVIPLFKL